VRKWLEFCLRNISIHARKVLLHAVNLRHGTDGFTSPPKEVVLRIFSTLKNPRSGKTDVTTVIIMSKKNAFFSSFLFFLSVSTIFAVCRV
jgi:hypothetical protein